jgi:uncharacterized membrane protein
MSWDSNSARRDAWWRAGIGAAALLAPAIVDVEHFHLIPFCPFRTLTGLPCPLCGMTRALSHLWRGEWDEAVALHALSPMVFTLLVVVVLVELWRGWRGGREWVPAHAAPLVVGVLLAYGGWRWFGG